MMIIKSGDPKKAQRSWLGCVCHNCQCKFTFQRMETCLSGGNLRQIMCPDCEVVNYLKNGDEYFLCPNDSQLIKPEPKVEGRPYANVP